MNNSVNLNRSLNLWHIVLFGLAYMVPMTVFSTYGVVVEASKGMVPAAYLVALVGMLFTAYSYAQMARSHPFAGSAYTYTQKSINSHTGFLVGWALLLDYLFIPMVDFLVSGIFLSATFPSVPTWVWVATFIIIVTFIDIRGIKITANLNYFFIGFQFLVVLLFLVLSIKGILEGEGAGTLFSALPFFNPDTSGSTVLSGASIVVLSFLGFDAVTTLSEETINPKRVIPKAIFLIVLLGGVLFIVVSYITAMVYPDYHSFKDSDAAAIEIAKFVGGNLFVAIFLAAKTIGSFASGLASHASVSRLLFAMGRDAILPKKVFGYLHPKYKTPVFNMIIVSVLAFTSVFLGLDFVASFINFGALIGFTFVNFSVIAYFYVRKKKRSFKNTILYLVIPLIGSVTTIVLWIGLSSYSKITGCLWIFVGFIYLMSLTKMFRKRPPEINFDVDQSFER